MRVHAVFDRWLLLGEPAGPAGGQVPVVDGVTGLALVGVGFFVRFGRVLEAPGGCYPREADELNGLLRVSFDHVHGLRFWPGEGLGGFEVVSWFVGVPEGELVIAPEPVSREVFEGLVSRCGERLLACRCLQSTVVDFVDAATGESLGRLAWPKGSGSVVSGGGHSA